MEMFAHGLMFHYFHGMDVPYTQGAISEKEFLNILSYYKKEKKCRIISAKEYMNKTIDGTISQDEVCLTFDDGLTCAFNVAWPVMRELGLTGFWFIYTGPYTGEPDLLEIYRLFRNRCFASIGVFYQKFEETLCEHKSEYSQCWKSKEASRYKQHIRYYSVKDRRFRYMRDCVLAENEYKTIMENMMATAGFCWKEEAEKIHISKEKLRELEKSGNIIGLHSHTHPTVMNTSPFQQKEWEYSKNKEVLEEIIGKKIQCAAYPDGSVDEESLDIMKMLGVKMAFIEHMKYTGNQYMIPRIDSADILNEIGG